ncbi:MAG TPA: carboxypeptidase-like regulatory domain-containing protein, partial [Pedobacter sp.]
MEKNYSQKMRGIMYSIRAFLLLSVMLCSSMIRAENLRPSNFKSERLDTYLKKIELAYQVSFVYDATQISKSTYIEVPSRLVSINADLEPLKEKGINYSIIGKQVILVKVPVMKKKEIITVTGHVTAKKDADALPGVSVREKGIANGVSTNPDGIYKIRVSDEATLVFSSVGYKTVEIHVNGRAVIDVVLEEDAGQLQEVNIVSTGYQELNKKLFTGSAVSLKASDVRRDGITDVSRMLEGRVAGVSVQNVSGTFGAAPKIRVRGATSITGDNKPLWVVDGIILEDVVNISNEQLSTGDPSTLVGSSVAGLNPDDIESFNILKDAAATAQYGARAMNGVVIITTKKGRNSAGKPVVSYTGNFSTYMKPSYSQFDILNSSDQMSVYLEMQNKGWLNHANTSRNENGGVFAKMFNQMYIYNAATDSYAL